MAAAWRAIGEAPEELYCKSNQKSQHNEIAARISTFSDALIGIIPIIQDSSGFILINLDKSR